MTKPKLAEEDSGFFDIGADLHNMTTQNLLSTAYQTKANTQVKTGMSRGGTMKNQSCRAGLNKGESHISKFIRNFEKEEYQSALSSTKRIPVSLNQQTRYKMNGNSKMRRNVNQSYAIPGPGYFNNQGNITANDLSKRMSLQDNQEHQKGYTTDDQLFYEREGSKNSINPFLAGGPSNDITTVNTHNNQQINSPSGFFNGKGNLFSPDSLTENRNITLVKMKYKTPHSAEINKALK